MKHFFIKVLYSLFFLFLSLQSFSQTVTTTIIYSGFQACGGCKVCGSDYWCLGIHGSYCGDEPNCLTRTFSDPVPPGHIVTNVTLNYWTANCAGAAIFGSINGFSVPVAYDGNDGCWCSNLPCGITSSVTASYPCGMPGYIYEGTNSLQMCVGTGEPDPSVCFSKIELIFTYVLPEVITPSITPSGSLSFCQGGNVVLTANSGYSAYNWSTGANTQSITVSTSGIYSVSVTSSTGCTTGSSSVTVNVNPKVVPNFAAIPAFCSGSIPPVLSNTSPNGVVGTWSPPSINNTTSGIYTFTPNAGICATAQTLNVTVTPNITPNFPSIPPFCTGSVPPILGNTSPNGITGTWSPAIINNTASGTYVFTPSPGQCATTQTLSVIVKPATINPNFSAIPTFCSGSVAPILGNTSPNGITGIWFPATINNTTSGIYTFTPNAGQCATNQTLNVTVTPKTIPDFAAIPSFCIGSTVLLLGNTSPNGISGSWNPSVINNTTSGIYTFTPNSGECATTQTLNVTVNPKTVPNFASIPAFCIGSTSPVLGNVSPNGITGSWNPSIISNTTSGVYSFTPNAGECATNQTLSVTVNNKTVPNFAAIPAFCFGSTAPILGTTSPNGITGTWIPATISNTASGTYTFTPNAGECAINQILNVTVTNQTSPNFTDISAFCSGSATPALVNTSPNGISGTWSPSVINNTISGTYTFTPNAGQCAIPQTLNITVYQNPAVNAGADTEIGSCSNSSYLMTPSATGTISNWSWTPSAGLTSTNTPNPIAHPVFTTTYSVTVSDSNGCTASDNILINVRPLPTSNAGSDVSIGSCTSSDTTLFGVGTGSGPLLFSWNPSIGITPLPPTGQNARAKPDFTTTYILTVTDKFGCDATDNVVVTVNPLPTSEAGNSDSIGSCISSTITLHGTGTGTSLNYSWSPSNGLTNPNSQNTVAKPSNTTTYQLNVYDVYGCVSTDNVTVTVIDFFLDAGPDAERGACNTSIAVLNGDPDGIGPFSNISWSPTNGLSSLISYSPVTAMPNQTTTYTLTMSDVFGCSASDNVTVTVHPIPVVEAGSNDSIGSCSSSVAQLNGNATGSMPLEYSWTPTFSLSNANTANPIAKPISTTIYTLTVSDSFNCSASDDVTITVKPLPTTNAGIDTTIGYCSASVALLSGTGTGTAALSYLWSPTIGIGNVNSPITTAKPNATTMYVLTVNDMFGCKASDDVTINVSPVAVEAGNDVAIGTCAGSFGQINASATGSGPFLYNWSPPTGLSQINIANPIAQPSVTTTYSLDVKDFFGCFASDTITVSVNIFDENVLHFTMLPDHGCQPLSILFGFNPNNQIVPNSWLWHFGDNFLNTSTEQNPSHLFANIGNYIVNLTVTTIYGCEASYSETVKVNRMPIAEFVNHPEVGSSDNPQIEFFNQSSFANYWLWNFGDIASNQENFSNSENSFHIFSDTGVFKVLLIAISNEGCYDTSYRYINIYQDFAFFIPNAFTPNKDGNNEVFLPQGIGFRANGYLMLIYDRWGKLIFKNEDINKGWDAISPDGNPYPQGVYTYIVTIFEDSGKKRILKGVVNLINPDN